MDTKSVPRVEVLWRPGCPFCSRLRRGLDRAGVATVEHDIWADPSAAARVQKATGGDETVPTVVIGRQALVNPSVAQVLAALRAEFPDDPEPTAVAAAPSGWTGAGWAGVVLVAWVLLAVWRPTTTWHLAPGLLAAAGPWVTGQDVRSGDRRGAVRIGWA
ncbi:MAG TPA: glutaredoxin domain-containing protein [Pseudonocardia sp.]|jgi:glutaredoxin|nr:glutaredoxin domain-containing protein [Pseudonocardia sp.]